MAGDDSYERSYKVKVRNCWGIGSLRQCSGFPVSASKLQSLENGHIQYDCPLGCYIVRWDIVDRKKVIHFQANEDLVAVFCKSYNDGFVLSVSYSGMGIIWTGKYEKVTAFCFPSNYVIYGAWSKYCDRFGICSKGPNARLGIYDVIRDASGAAKVNLITVIVCPQTCQTGSNNDNKFNCYDVCLFTQSSEIVAVYQTYDAPCEVHLFNSDGKFLRKCSISPLGDPETVMLCTSEEKDGVFAIGLQGGLFQFVECKDLNTKGFFQASGSPQVCLWDGDKLVTVSYLSGKVLWWDSNCEIVKELDGAPGGSIVKVNWGKDGKYMWVGGLMSLSYVEIPTTEGDVIVKYTLEKHQLSGCGIAVSSNQETASGDLAGNIFVWKDGVADYQYHADVSEMVRCITWCERNVIIGTLDGNIYLLNLDAVDESPISMDVSIPTLIFSIKGGVLCFDLRASDRVLVFGTTTGHAFLLNFDDKFKFTKLDDFLVHGSKHGKEMEVWSVCFSPLSSMLATASEDYTCVIIDWKSGEVIKTLTGHTMAVTSVDWKILADTTSCLATCSDDRTVRVYNGKDLSLRFVLNTYDIYGWHTLTYLKINPVSESIVCSTQNGYVVVWDIAKQQCLVKRRVHNGSVEGLSWSPNYKFFATIGSDGVVNNISLKLDKSPITL